MWELRNDFTDPRPYEFQLQVGRTSNNEADDWEDVGSSVVDQFAAMDGEQRIYGKTNFTHYRVKLTTPQGVHLSEPVGLMGTLSRRDWRIAREYVRKEILRMKHHAGERGLLLKRRVAGDPCPTCLDYQTREVRDPNCPDCWGTGFKCGYFFPMSCVWADISPRTYRIHRDNQSQRGTVNDVVVKARIAHPMMLSEEDIWVNAKTDDRYYIHQVQNVAEMRGVPITAEVEMRPAPVTDVAYDIPVPQIEPEEV
jgi:hypothetical protein